MTEHEFKPRTKDAAYELCSWMFEHGVQVKALAIDLGISVVALGRWRNGHAKPSLKHALDLERITKGRVAARLWGE
jgi:transcriptional regulator with XRE-family HTH domain